MQKLSNMFGSSNEDYWFPGRWMGGTSLIVAPLLLLTGACLRLPFHFFFPQQLAAFQQQPTLMTASYSFFLAGTILLWPAILTLAKLIGQTHPGWATWGGTMVIFGLFARTFHAGIDHLAFQLVQVQTLPMATQAVAGSYGAFHVVSAISPVILFGWIVLALGAYLSRTLHWLPSLGLGLMAALMIGVLKGSSWVSIISLSGLCIALVPLGLKVLTVRPQPTLKTFILRFIFAVGFTAALFFLGQLG